VAGFNRPLTTDPLGLGPEDRADWLDQAISEHRKLKKILTEMRRLSLKIMRIRFPDTERRPPLNKRLLRLI
jgi:hypothetical protein